MFPNLKLQIFRCGSHQNQLAKAVGIDETVLSKIIRGYRDPTANQRKILASYLEADEAWLFERFETATHRAEAGNARVAPVEEADDHGDD
jgi:transcriptional regulator with XRE-family HTH domain